MTLLATPTTPAGAMLAAGPWGGHMWGSGPGWMWLWMVLLWLVVLAAVVWLVSSTQRRDRPADTSERARQMLAERYARGDIDTEEYHERLDALR